jgi:hypothetical protein
MKPTIITCAGWMCATIIFRAMAIDESKQATFFDSVEVRYRQEYKACTGDMSFVPARDLIQWKEEMNALAVSKEYLALLKEYRKVDSNENILPCKVLAWNAKRKEMQTAREDTLGRDLLAREEYENAVNEAKTCAKSAYDIPGLPFGITKRSFLLIFKNTFPVEFNDQGQYIYVNDLMWGGRTFLTAFYFDKKTGLFNKYEIETPSVPANRLNSVVRPDADSLVHALAVRFGEPVRRFSIGFFDIKSGVLCPYKTWDSPGFDIFVGLSMNKYRYYAKAVVAAKDLRRKPAAPDSGAVKP